MFTKPFLYVLIVCTLFLSNTGIAQQLQLIPGPEFSGNTAHLLGQKHVFNDNIYVLFVNQSNNIGSMHMFDGENFTIIPNPSGRQADQSTRFIYNNAITIAYSNTSDAFRKTLAFHDGNSLSTVNTPSGFTSSGYNSLYHIVYQGDLLLRYRHNSGYYRLFRWNGSNLTALTHPPSNYDNINHGYMGEPIFFDNKVYMRYLRNVGVGVLKAFDGNDLIEIPNVGGSNYQGQPIVFNDKLYLQYRIGATGRFKLYYHQDSTITMLNNPPNHSDNNRGYSGDPIIFQDKLYLRYMDNDGLRQLYQYDGNQLTLIPSPPNHDGFGRGYHGGPFIHKDRLYMIYRNNDNLNQLAVYDGDSIKIIENSHPGFTGSYNGFLGGNFEFNGRVYLRYRHSDGYYQRFMLDGDDLIPIENPPHTDQSNRGNTISLPVEFQGDMYLNYQNNDQLTQLYKMPGTSVWTGAEDTDWFNENNWENGNVPHLGSKVIIPEVNGFYPEIDTTVRIAILQIEDSASLTINPGSWIGIYTELDNQGTIDPTELGCIQTDSTDFELIVSSVIRPEGPTGDPIQELCSGLLVENLDAQGAVVFWYGEPKSDIALDLSQPLEDSTFYYATLSVDGCESNERLEVFVTFIPEPVADIKNDTSACTLFVLEELSAGNTYYTEPNGQGSMLTAGTEITETTTLYIFTENQCGADENLLLIEINDVPNHTVTADTTYLNANQNNATYQWYNCETGLPIEFANHQSFIASEEGSFSVLVTLNGCEAMSDCIDVIFTGIEEAIISSKLEIYPNPNSGKFILNAVSQPVEYAIFNMLGKKVHEGNTSGESTELDVSHLSKGTYFLRVGKSVLQFQITE